MGERMTDPGLPVERTAIGWQRTGLSIGGLSVLLVHSSPTTLTALPGVIGMVCALFVLLLAQTRYRRVARRVAKGAPVLHERLVLTTAVLVCGFAVTSLVLAALGAAG